MNNEPKPLVSIITPSFNEERFILETIASVKKQTFTNWELIVSDDASTDRTTDLVKWQAEMDSRIRLFVANNNQGPGPTRNRALRAAQGRYVAFLDSGDLWKPNKLAHQLEFIELQSALFSFTSYEIIDENGKPYNTVINAPACLDYSDLLKNTIIGCLTVMIDRTRSADLNLTMPDIPTRQPLVVWLRILKTGVVAFGLDEILAQYRIVKGSISRNKFQAAKNVWKVYRKYEGLNLSKSAYYFLNYAINGFLRNKR